MIGEVFMELREVEETSIHICRILFLSLVKVASCSSGLSDCFNISEMYQRNGWLDFGQYGVI